MNKNTKLLFAHKTLFDVYFYGAITVPFFVSKGYGISAALTIASSYMIASMAMEVPTGVVGDRYGHKLSVLLGSTLTGIALVNLLLIDNFAWDTSWIVMLAVGAALASGSDTALLRAVSNDFKRDNRIFDYLKNTMLLLSFGAAGFVVKCLGMDTAIGLSGLVALTSVIPLALVDPSNSAAENNRRAISLGAQIAELPRALSRIRGGFALVLLAGLAGAVTFSAKEIISSFTSVYSVDISIIGLLAASAMAGRLLGTALERRVKLGHKFLLIILVLTTAATATIGANRASGFVFMLLTTVAAQMLYYRLKYRLSSEAPQSHVAAILSGLSLVGRLFGGGVIMLTGLFAGAGYFHLSFVCVSLILLVFGVSLATRLHKSDEVAN